MPRAKTSTVLVLLAFVTFAGCTRNDPTAPSEPPVPALDEHQGANN